MAVVIKLKLFSGSCKLEVFLSCSCLAVNV